MKNKLIITTPMCEKILQFVKITNYKINKNPDNEKGDLAIILSENQTKMDSLNIKLNTFTQIKESIIKVSDYSPKGQISEKEINEIFTNYKIANKWLNSSNKLKNKYYNISVKVYTNFLKDIVCDMGFNISSRNPDYLIFPDYLADTIKNKEEAILVEIPTHENVPKDPIERAELRYSILENIL
jgi:segregation and condensation protein B